MKKLSLIDKKKLCFEFKYNLQQKYPYFQKNFPSKIIQMHSTEIQHRNDYGIDSGSIERAKKMSIDEIQKKQNRSQSIQNILSSSIAKAKQKIQMMQQKKNIKDYRDSISNRSVQKKQNKDVNTFVGKYPPMSQPQNQQSQTGRSRRAEQIQTTRSKQPNNKTQSNSAIVSVVKSLQIKISELQKLNQSIERQKNIMTKQLNNVSEEKRLLLQNMEEVKKKNLHLQHTIIKSTKQQIKQLQHKTQKLEGQNLQLKNQIKQLELKLKQQHQNHLSIQKNNQKRMKQKKEQQKNQQKTQMIYISKLKQTELYQRNLYLKDKQLLEKQNKIQLKWKQIFAKEEQITQKQKVIQQKQRKNYEDLVRHNQTMELANQVRKQLEEKNNQMKKLLEQDKKKTQEQKTKIKQLQCALEKQQSLKEQAQVRIAEMYTNKINQLEDQLHQIKQSYKYNSKSKLSTITKNDKIDTLKDQLADVMEQYEELMTRYKKNDEKLQKEQKQTKNYRSKFWKLKQIIAEISQKVSKMPQAIHSQLKLLIVKANKLESYQIQKSSLSHIYGTPSKKSRSNTAEKSLSKLSKQRSKSKQKSAGKHNTMNFTQLDSSRKSNHSVKSKRSQKSQRSLSKKKEVIISTTNKNMMNESDMKISLLQKQIQSLKNNYKKLVEIMNEKNDQQTRNQLNNLVFELQQKSEELTKLKKQRKAKKF